MKVELLPQKNVFNPLTVSIVLESQDEIDALTAIFNTPVSYVMQYSKRASSDTVGKMQIHLWETIHHSSTIG